MRASDFTYTFPSRLIALHPPKVRGQSRLLVLDRSNGQPQHRRYRDMADYVQSGDVVILNDTKVIKARLLAKNVAGHSRELLLLEEHGPHSDHHHWRCLFRGSLAVGEQLATGKTTVIVDKVHPDGTADVSSPEDLYRLAERLGSTPLPPYMKRNATVKDTKRYQTVFARQAGSVAAPTASLNFTKQLEQKLRTKGVIIAYLTLHVGLGTFLPIRTDELEKHKMHSEYFEIPKNTVDAIQRAKQAGRKALAVGTTVTRTLESRATQILTEAPQNLSGEADIFIYPGYKFKVVDQLLTNFHAPRSTVLMLTAAFAGWPLLKKAYEEAVKKDYALLSYGDSMLIL